MFNGNKLVLILPALLMALMFYGGYHFLSQNEVMTHEELEEKIVLDVDAAERKSGWAVRVNWDWTAMPDGGLYGEDYISVVVYGETGSLVREDVSYQDAELQLIYGDEVIYRTEGELVENGIIFAFPNEFDEHKSYGNLGEVHVIVEGDNIKKEDISVQLLHTWVNHSPLTKEDARLINPDFSGAKNVPYWKIERSPQAE